VTWPTDHKARVAQFPAAIREAHTHSANHRRQIESSDLCGCFYCTATFKPSEIKDWVDKNNEGIGQTALCARCGIDSVIGSLSGYPITAEFLAEMRRYWFS
jgi:hypothetical protein